MIRHATTNPRPRRRPRRLSPASRRLFAARLTALVILAQLALPFAFHLDPSDPPAAGTFWAALWALFHRPAFYPLIALLLIGPAATYLAAITPGRHRPLLAAAWLIYLPLLIHFHGHRIAVMLRILWDHSLTI